MFSPSFRNFYSIPKLVENNQELYQLSTANLNESLSQIDKAFNQQSNSPSTATELGSHYTPAGVNSETNIMYPRDHMSGDYNHHSEVNSVVLSQIQVTLDDINQYQITDNNQNEIDYSEFSFDGFDDNELIRNHLNCFDDESNFRTTPPPPSLIDEDDEEDDGEKDDGDVSSIGGSEHSTDTFDTADTHFEDYDYIREHETENMRIFTRLSHFRVPPLAPYQADTIKSPELQAQDKQEYLNMIQAHGYSEFDQDKVQSLCEEIWEDIYKFEPRFKDAPEEITKLVLMKSHVDLKYFPSMLDAKRINSQLTLFAEVPLDVFENDEVLEYFEEEHEDNLFADDFFDDDQSVEDESGETFYTPSPEPQLTEEVDLSSEFVSNTCHFYVLRSGDVPKLVLDEYFYMTNLNVNSRRVIDSISTFIRQDFFANPEHYDFFPLSIDIHMVKFDIDSFVRTLNEDSLVSKMEITQYCLDS